MKKQHFLVFVITAFLTLGAFAQDIENKVVDALYKEDQFYIGVQYNLINNKPKGVTQNGFSLGFNLGYIKDMPLNKQRNVALGIGLGYATNSYVQNMLIRKNDLGVFTYSVLDNSVDFSKNKFSDHVLELPVEFRWRTSTVASYKFWRIYTGVKFGYAFITKSKFKSPAENLKYKSIKEYNNFQYGLTLNLGYNTWNLSIYYGLNSIFSDEATIDGKIIDSNAIKIGLMFYVY